jgi:Tol biopolymer transport system component
LIGKTLGQYKILDKIGEGGMGVVFRARDTSLNRDVAIKILPSDMSGDPERAARFEREARTLASLQHPNIATIYGYDKSDGVRFLVMELVEGEDLSQRLSRGPVPLDEAVEIAKQIAAGLEAAHERGIVHRDLKPANVKLTPEGDVKVLDFGLARAYLGDVGEESSLEQSPTITAAMTAAGVILGTAAYMSPEQARGKRADKRTDLWAFGVILFEMLTGMRLFAGETVSDTMAAVLRAEPDFDLLPSDTPAGVRRLLRRCLKRDPRLRMRSAGDAILDLEEAEDMADPTAASVGGSRRLWGLVGVLLVALVATWFLRPGGEAGPGDQRSLHLDIVLDEGLTIGSTAPALSPDGRWLAFTVTDSINRDVLYFRSLEHFGNEMAGEVDLRNNIDVGSLFWSPDSKQLGIVSGTTILTMDVATRITQKAIDGMAFARGATWGPDGTVLYAPGSNSGLFAIASFGAEPRQVTAIDTTRADASHRWPVFLPDGYRFLFTSWSNAADEQDEIGGVYLGALDGREPVRLLRDASQALLDPDGFLLFHRSGNLMQVAFDLDSGEIHGNPSIVATDLTWNASNGSIMASVSATGDLVLATAPPVASHSVGWVEKDGSGFEPVLDVAGQVFGMRLSHSGRYASLNRLTVGSSMEIWIADLDRRTLSLLSRFGSDCWGGTFSPDGKQVVYTGQDPGFERLYAQAIDGATEPRGLIDLKSVGTEPDQWITSDQLIFSQRPRTSMATEIWLYEFSNGESRPLLVADYSQSFPMLSPDGRWLAYQSDESGRNEIYIRPYPALNRKWQVSTEGGMQPHWRQDGRELFYSTAPGRIQAVQITPNADDIDISSPQIVVDFDRTYRMIVVTDDHRRFLVSRVARDPKPAPLRFITNWRAKIETGEAE